jgi:hypothetical protein
VIGT